MNCGGFWSLWSSLHHPRLKPRKYISTSAKQDPGFIRAVCESIINVFSCLFIAATLCDEQTSPVCSAWRGAMTTPWRPTVKTFTVRAKKEEKKKSSRVYFQKERKMLIRQILSLKRIQNDSTASGFSVRCPFSHPIRFTKSLKSFTHGTD